PRFHANRRATQSDAVAIVSHSGDLKSEQSPVNCCFSLVLPVDHALANNFDAATMSVIGPRRTLPMFSGHGLIPNWRDLLTASANGTGAYNARNDKIRDNVTRMRRESEAQRGALAEKIVLPVCALAGAVRRPSRRVNAINPPAAACRRWPAR